MITSTEIGKITDAGLLVAGGRIDDYWKDHDLVIDKSISDSHKTYNNVWTFNPDQALIQFGLRSIEFGNWMNQNDRAFYLYNSTVSLLHLSKLFNIPTQLVGFNGKLSIALGARGKTEALAHYEHLPNIIINLTKKGGKHSLAHEYGHAIDNLIGFFIKNKSNTMISGGSATKTNVDWDKLYSGNWFEKKFEELFKVLYWNKKDEKSSFLIGLKKEGSEYLMRRTEVFARTFEVYIHNKLIESGIDNEFLTKKSKFNFRYPNKKLMKKATPIIDNIMKAAYQLFSERQQLGAVDVISQNNEKLEFNGFSPSYKKLKSYDHLILGSSTGNKTETIYTGGLDKTIKAIKSVIKKYKYQLKPLAQHLKADTLNQSSFNIWHFIKTNIRYDFDLAGFEEIRTPARSWKDRLDRADCEDYSIFAAILLLNMGYKPNLRIVAFNNKDQYQHIYITTGKNNNIVIDAVLNKYNVKPKYITKVMDIQILSGTDELGAVPSFDDITKKLMRSQTSMIKEWRKTKNPVLKKELRKIRYLITISGSEERNQILPIMSEIRDITKDGKFIFKKDADLEIIGNYLEIIQKDEGVDGVDGIGEIGSLNYNDILLKVAKKRIIGIKNDVNQLVDNGDLKLNKNSQLEINNDLDLIIDAELNGLGGLSGFWGKIKGAIKKVAVVVKKTVVYPVKIAIKATKAIAKATIKVTRAILKYNPLTILARTAFLGLVRLNFKHLGVTLALGYASASKLQSLGYNSSVRMKIADRKNRIEKLWSGLGGRRGALIAAIRASKKAKAVLNGLGEPFTIGGAVVAAAGILAKVFSVIKKGSKVIKIGKKLVGGARSASSAIRPRRRKLTPRDHGFQNKDEQDFVNNELYPNSSRTPNDPNAGSGGSKKTMLWIGLSVLALGGVYMATRPVKL